MNHGDGTRAARHVLLGMAGLFLWGALSVAQEPGTTPAVPLSEKPATPASQIHLLVREFRFESNTVFSASELAKITAPYLNRELTSMDLEEARRAVTLYYVRHGYINSGVVLPDQEPSGGIIRMRVIEGRLSEIKLSTTNEFFKTKGWLSPSYITNRIDRWAGTPLNMNDLKDGLQILKQNPNIKQVNAALEPGAAPGESVLALNVKEENPFHAELQVDNQRPPSVGSEEILLRGADANLTGHSDRLDFGYGIARNSTDGFEFSGLDDEQGSYTLPVTIWDTTFTVFGSRSDSLAGQEPVSTNSLTPLNITSRLIHYGVTLRQPVYRTANRELALSITFDRGTSETFLLGQPFDLDPGSVDGQEKTTVLRISQEWLDRSQTQVLALRSTFNVGLDLFGTTDDGTDRNAQFFSWLGQAQYVRRLFGTQNLLVLRTDGQWTDKPLLALEQFAVGGANTVRGYQENQLVRDRGVVASAEVRIPVLFDKAQRPIIQIAPFYDFGGAWNVQTNTPGPATIMSAGVGVLVNPNKHLSGQMYWGYRFTPAPTPHDNIQDLGITFKVVYEAF